MIKRFARASLTVFMFLSLIHFGAAESLTVAVAGDIACSPTDEPAADKCQMGATAALIDRKHVAAVLAVGDLQYPQGDSGDFAGSYAKNWGRFKTITFPVPGNHEYYLYNAQGYYRYFGVQAHPENHGYYSADLGAWHLIALNSNCFWVGGCGEGSPQLEWLKNDLRAHPARCTLAFWHNPRFSSGPHGSDASFAPFWDALVAARADVVVSAHDHLYERFAPLLSDGTPSVLGLPEFVVGTGGKSLYEAERRQPHSATLVQGSFGVLFLQLKPNAYSWRFETITGRVADKGVGRCR